MTDRLSGTDPSEFKVGGDEQDELFEVLSDSRRRFTLQYLRTAETPLPVGELATELLSWEGQRSATQPSGDDRNAVEISLAHNHLPKMDEAGFVSYDATRRMVTLADRTDEVRSYLQATSIN